MGALLLSLAQTHAQQPPLTIASPRAAQPQINRPVAARRLVAEFTFDDPEPFPVPRHWDLAQDGSEAAGGRGAGGAAARAGYPRWNKAELDASAAFHGRGSVKLSTTGGSVCLRLQPGVIPVFPDAEYLISAHVRTQSLEHARARLTTRYLDKTNRPIPGTESPSELVGGTSVGQASRLPSNALHPPSDIPNPTSDGWTPLATTLPNGHADAAYIQIDLEILQPERFEASDLGKHQVWPQDFSGQAWFDEVTVVQLPRVRISTGSATNVIVRPTQPSVSISIRDLTGEAMTGELILQDSRGVTVDRATRSLESGLSKWDWTPAATELGWYRATLELRTGERRVGSTHVDFAWVDRATDFGSAKSVLPSRDLSRFGIILGDLPPSQRMLVPEMLRLAGAGSVSIPVWTAGLKPDQVQPLAQSLVPLIDALKADWRRISFSLPRIPDELAATAHFEPERPLALFGADPKLWSPYLDPLLDKFGQGVQQWQVGNPGSAVDPQDLGAPLAALHRSLSRLVPGPVIALPWPGELTPPASLAADTRIDLLATLPSGIPAESLPVLAGGWGGGPGAATTLVVQPLPEGEFSRRDAAAALVKQVVALWGVPPSAGQGPRPPSSPNFALTQPWDWPGSAEGGSRTQVMPRAEFAAYRNLSQRLAGRRLAGSLAVRGATCFIFGPAPDAAPGRSGTLVAWQNTATPEPVALDAFLGQGPITLVDIFGNTRALETDVPGPVGRASNLSPGQRSHHVPLSDEPLFVEGVDVELALFAASFALDPVRLPPTGAEHDLSIVLSNPWPTPIEGRLTILEPGGLSQGAPSRDRSWRITPRTAPFAIAPGQSARIPLTVAFSAVEESGLKDFVAQIELAGARDYGPIRLRTSLEVGLDSSPLDLSYQISGQDIVLEAQVTNRGTTPATFEVAAFAPGYARQKASISDLAPGSSATRRFAFPNGQTRLRADRITVGLQDLESKSRINRSISID